MHPRSARAWSQIAFKLALRTGGRVAEDAPPKSVYVENRIAGSNPALCQLPLPTVCNRTALFLKFAICPNNCPNFGAR